MADKETKTPPVDLAAENALLRARIAELEARAKQNAADEEVIAAKMARGLSREQAQWVIARQRAFDATKKTAAPAKTK
jgi:hypothetical protein